MDNTLLPRLFGWALASMSHHDFYSDSME